MPYLLRTSDWGKIGVSGTVPTMTDHWRFELVTIDLDDTVWPSMPVLLRAEEALYRWLQRVAPRLADVHPGESLRQHRLALMRERPEIAHDITRVRLESLRSLLREHGYDPRLAAEALTVFLHHRNQVQPYQEVADVLREVAARHRLISITNGNSEPGRTPLRGLFHRSLSAAVAGAAKPDPAIFRMALDWAGARAEQAVHVGDDPRLDMAAARATGMATVWVNRTGQVWPSELHPPDAEVADLNGLADWLRGEGRAI
jgi:HAD superfamily hydrolase (TIGR01509 family)